MPRKIEWRSEGRGLKSRRPDVVSACSSASFDAAAVRRPPRLRFEEADTKPAEASEPDNRVRAAILC